MAPNTVTLTFNGQKKTFKFGKDVQGFQLSKWNQNNVQLQITSFYTQGQGGKVKANTKAEYDALDAFLHLADVDKNGTIEAKDLSLLQGKFARRNAPLSAQERQQSPYPIDDESINIDRKDGTSFSIVF